MKLENKLTILFLAFALFTSCSNASTTNNQPAEEKEGKQQQEEMQIDVPEEYLDSATLGAGCFWCVEAIFQDVKGVVHVESGYSGGHVENPSYNAVCSGTTGHIEVARIVYDNRVLNFETLLDVFWHTHNPTTKDQQGADKGEQYRSVIFYHNDEQKRIAEESMKKTDATDLWSDPIVTVIEPLENYYKAEDYHQNYYNNNKEQGYCSVVIGPKIAKFRKQFPELLKSSATQE